MTIDGTVSRREKGNRTYLAGRCTTLIAAAARQGGLQDIEQQQSLGQDSTEDVYSLDNEDSWDDAVSAGEEGEEEGEESEQEEDEAPAVMPATAAKKRLDIPMSQTQVAYIPDDFVEVGLISRAHGIKGEVKVQLLTDEPKKRLGTANKRLWLLPPPGRVATGAVAAGSGSGADRPLLLRVVVQWGRVARPESKDRRAEWAVKFKEVLDRDEDEFFITDLVGLRALGAGSGMLLGVVTEVYDSTASYSLLRVRLAPNEEDIQQSRRRLGDAMIFLPSAGAGPGAGALSTESKPLMYNIV
eukprot:gene12964-13093_t